MDSQVRNFRDFLQLYNKLTETCFQHCVENFFTRDLSSDESKCLDKCVLKFSNVNQRVMGSYIAEQSLINERRMHEGEAQMQASNKTSGAPDTSTAISDVLPPIAPIDNGTASVSEHIEVTDDPSQNRKILA